MALKRSESKDLFACYESMKIEQEAEAKRLLGLEDERKGLDSDNPEEPKQEEPKQEEPEQEEPEQEEPKQEEPKQEEPKQEESEV